MPSADSFLNLADIAIVFAGFAAISVVLGRRQSSDFSIANAARLSVMIELSICSALVALLPSAILGFGVSPSATWRVSCSVALAYAAASAIRGGVLRSRSARVVPQEVHPPSGLALVVCLRVLAIVSAGLGVFGAFSGPGPLFLSLASNLALSAFLFVGSLWGLREALQAPADE